MPSRIKTWKNFGKPVPIVLDTITSCTYDKIGWRIDNVGRIYFPIITARWTHQSVTLPIFYHQTGNRLLDNKIINYNSSIHQNYRILQINAHTWVNSNFLIPILSHQIFSPRKFKFANIRKTNH